MENIAAPSGAANMPTIEEVNAWTQIQAMLKEIEQMREDIRADREQVAKDAASTWAKLNRLQKSRGN